MVFYLIWRIVVLLQVRVSQGLLDGDALDGVKGQHAAQQIESCIKVMRSLVSSLRTHKMSHFLNISWDKCIIIIWQFLYPIYHSFFKGVGAGFYHVNHFLMLLFNCSLTGNLCCSQQSWFTADPIYIDICWSKVTPLCPNKVCTLEATFSWLAANN